MSFSIPVRPRLLGLGVVFTLIAIAMPVDGILKGVLLVIAMVVSLLALIQEIQRFRRP